MQLRYRQQVTAAGVSVVALALTLAACSSSSSSSTPSGGSVRFLLVERLGQASAAPSTASGSTFQLNFQQAAIAAFKSVQPEHHRQLRRRRLGQGPQRPGLGDRAVRGLRLARPRQGGVELHGQDDPVLPGHGRADHHRVQPVGRQQPEAVRDDHRGHLPGKIKTWNDPAIKADQLRGQPAQHRDHPRPSARTPQAPRLTSPSSWWTPRAAPGSSAAARPSTGRPRPGRQRQRRVAQIVKSTPGAIGYMDFANAKASGLSLRFDQEQGRRLRRAVASVGLGGGQPGHRQARPDLHRGLGGRGQLLPDHLPVMGPGLPNAANANDAACSRRTWATCSATARSCSPSSASRRCPPAIDQQAIAQLSKIGIVMVSIVMQADRTARRHEQRDQGGSGHPGRVRRPAGRTAAARRP